MLEWGSPLWFLALPLAVAAPWLVGRPRLAVAALGALRWRRSPRQVAARALPVVASLGLALLVVALARPQHVDRERVVEREGIDILLVVDTSRSMEAEDYQLGGRPASRLAVAKEVIAEFVKGRPDDRVGVVVFGEEALTQVPLTLDHDALQRFLGQIHIGMVGGRATAVGDALAVAVRNLAELDAESKVVVLLTDGRSNAGQISPLEASEAARALGVTVYTIGVGSDGGGGGGFFGLFASRRADLDVRTLSAIASTTGGRFFRAGDTAALAEVYATIDALEKSTAEVQELVHREERFLPFGLAGLALLLAHLALGETVLRRLP